MKTIEKNVVKVEATINAPVEKVWKAWSGPEHIVKWNNASEEWHTTKTENAFREGGTFYSRMEARDGSHGFDFTGEYKKIDKHKEIEYILDDGRRVQVLFDPAGNETRVTEIFDAEQSHPVEMQKAGWQAILDNFKKYVERLGKMETLHFEIVIDALPEKVYGKMLDERHYSEWTSEFGADSHFKGSWDKGSKILFIGTDQEGNSGGMVSRIKENIPGKFLSIEHLGIIRDGMEVTTGPETEWAGALENYTFFQEDDKTLLEIDMDVTLEFKSMFLETWPRALNKLKAICEG
jgi:uncharacterized protein YndB with AHSA1/START domain